MIKILHRHGENFDIRSKLKKSKKPKINAFKI